MKKQARIKEELVLVSLILYILSLTVIDFVYFFTPVILYSDLVSIIAVLIPAILFAVMRNTKARKTMHFTAIVIFCCISIPAVFLYFGYFESYRLLFFIPSIFIIMAAFRGRSRIITICCSSIVYIVCIIFVLVLQRVFTITGEPANLSAQLWSLVSTGVFLIIVSYVYLTHINNTVRDNADDVSCFDELENFSDKGILLCFYIENTAELREQIGSLDYHLLYCKIKKFMEEFRNDDTRIIPYAGDRFLLFFRKRDEDFIRDFADGVILCVNDDLNIKDPLMLKSSIVVKDSFENIYTAVRRLDCTQ